VLIAGGILILVVAWIRGGEVPLRPVTVDVAVPENVR